MAKDAFGDDIPMWGAAPAARAGDPSPEQERWSPAVPPSSNGWSNSESAAVHTETPVTADVPWPWLAGSALSVLAALALAAQAAGRPFLLAHLALFLLFTILECLPVLFKVILLLGKPSLYEQLTLLGEEAVLALQRLHLESAQRELTTEVAAANEPHETRLRNQLDTELAAAKAVLDAQADLASKAVGMWKRNQENLLETDLDAFVTTAAQTANAGAAPPGRSSTYADASSFFAPPTQNRGSAYRAGDGGNASPREDRGWRSATTVLPPEQVRWGGADQPPAAWPARIFSRLGWRSRSAGRR